MNVQKDTRGQELMNEVCQQLDLIEKDYFGLRYVDIEKQRVGLKVLCSSWHYRHRLRHGYVSCINENK